MMKISSQNGEMTVMTSAIYAAAAVASQDNGDDQKFFKPSENCPNIPDEPEICWKRRFRTRRTRLSPSIFKEKENSGLNMVNKGLFKTEIII
jgi:hypothetical protein